MRSFAISIFLFCLTMSPATAHADSPAFGTVSGVVRDQATHAALENATVLLGGGADSTGALRATTGRDGAFSFARVPYGRWSLRCGIVSHVGWRSPEFVLDAAHPATAFDAIVLKPAVLMLEAVDVTTDRKLFEAGIDRKVYQVSKDVMAQSGSAGDLLQNVPSVQVDIDGNVSLRGSTDVKVMINGKESPLLAANRAETLQQIPAVNIERIEVITNPSAKYTPEGTAGIINIVMKKGAGSGLNADLTGHAGPDGRHNENAVFGWDPGTWNVFGTLGVREDLRHRTGTDARTLAGPGAMRSYRQDDATAMRPHVERASLGAGFHPGAGNTAEVSADVFRWHPGRDSRSSIVARDAGGVALEDMDRRQSGGESNREAGVNASFEHAFAGEDHTLKAEGSFSRNRQSESTHFTDTYRVPAGPAGASDVRTSGDESEARLSADYVRPGVAGGKCEAGVSWERNRGENRSDADSLEVALGAIVADPGRTYRFGLTQTNAAAYLTFERAFGRLAAVAGLRGEATRIDADLVQPGAPFTNDDAGLYPTLHLSWKATARADLQASYSRRINRPDAWDLNPFPEFTDPYNMEAGNPHLKPESVHSFELGARWQGEHGSFVPTFYYRFKNNGFTRVTQAVNDSVFLRTMANLASDRSFGLEPVITVSRGIVQANVSGNLFHQRIDASNLGYSGTREVTSWSGSGNVNLSVHDGTMAQVSATYRSARLTPQGESQPSVVVNLGLRRSLWHDQVALTFTVSDVFATQRQDTRLEVAGISQRVTNRRDARMWYAGGTWHLGRPAKRRDKDRPFQYEDTGP